MSGMTGMEAARKIREQDEFCQLIFTTTTTEFAVDSYEVGAAFYLVKPFSKEKLEQALLRCGAGLLEQGQSVIVYRVKQDRSRFCCTGSHIRSIVDVVWRSILSEGKRRPIP